VWCGELCFVGFVRTADAADCHCVAGNVNHFFKRPPPSQEPKPHLLPSGPSTPTQTSPLHSLSPPAVKRLNGSTTAFRNYGVAHAVGAYTAEEAAATAAAAPAAAEQPAGEVAEPSAASTATAQDGDKPAEGAEGDKPAEPAKPKQSALIVSIAQSSVKQMRPGDRPPEWMRQGPAGGPYRPVPPGKR